MKKLISFFLSALTLVSLSLTAFAAPASESAGDASMSPASSNKPGVEVQATTHMCIKGSLVGRTWDTNYTYFDENTCRRGVYSYYSCTICNGLIFETTYDTASHSGPVYAASCSGTVQTWHCTCSRCGGRYTETHACQGKDHRNGCQWLPA